MLVSAECYGRRRPSDREIEKEKSNKRWKTSATATLNIFDVEHRTAFHTSCRSISKGYRNNANGWVTSPNSNTIRLKNEKVVFGGLKWLFFFVVRPKRQANREIVKRNVHGAAQNSIAAFDYLKSNVFWEKIIRDYLLNLAALSRTKAVDCFVPFWRWHYGICVFLYFLSSSRSLHKMAKAFRICRHKSTQCRLTSIYLYPCSNR